MKDASQEGGEKRAPSLTARILRRAGYAPQARVRELAKALQRAEQRLGDMKRELDQARKEVRASSEKARELAERLAKQKADLEKRYEERLAKSERKIEREVARVREHAESRAERFEQVRERLTRAEKSNRHGEEHLMAIEVKFDIIEGAINVLDQRLRSLRTP